MLSNSSREIRGLFILTVSKVDFSGFVPVNILALLSPVAGVFLSNKFTASESKEGGVCTSSTCTSSPRVDITSSSTIIALGYSSLNFSILLGCTSTIDPSCLLNFTIIYY